MKKILFGLFAVMSVSVFANGQIGDTRSDVNAESERALKEGIEKKYGKNADELLNKVERKLRQKEDVARVELTEAEQKLMEYDRKNKLEEKVNLLNEKITKKRKKVNKKDAEVKKINKQLELIKKSKDKLKNVDNFNRILKSFENLLDDAQQELTNAKQELSDAEQKMIDVKQNYSTKRQELVDDVTEKKQELKEYEDKRIYADKSFNEITVAKFALSSDDNHEPDMIILRNIANNVLANKEELENRGDRMVDNEDKINTNAKDIAAIKDSIAKSNEAIEANKKSIASINSNFGNLQYGVAMVAAMDAASFSNLSAGDLEIAAGVATYAGKQATALGVAYAPTDKISFNAKMGVNFGEKYKVSFSAGAKYKVNLKK